MKRLRRGSETGNSEYQLADYERIAARAVHKSWDRLSLDVVYAFHNTNAALLLSQERMPTRTLVINLIGFGIDQSRGGTRDTFPLQNYIFQRPYWDLQVAATRFEYGQYRMIYEKLGLDPLKLLYLPHPYDEDVFYPDNRSTDEVGQDQEEKLLLYPVNVYRRKNIELAIDVVASLSQQWAVRLLITGGIWDQEYRRMLQERAEAQGVGDRVEFLGGVSLDRLQTLYREASVTLFTSHQETFGLGIVESLGSGTPVVGPNWIAPCKEILEGSYGGYCANKNVESLTNEVIRVFRQPPHPSRIAEDARCQYGNRAIASRFLRAVDDVRQQKLKQSSKVHSIDWKGLYRDGRDLL